VNRTNTTSLLSRRRFGALVFAGGLALAACGSDDVASTDTGAPAEAAASTAELSIADPWSRQPAEGQLTGAVYGVVTNDSDEDITAIGASTSVTDTVELHEVTMNDEGQMSMSEKEGGYVIPAGESFTFEPGGPHMMLLGIDVATYPDMVDVTLEFDTGATLDFTAEVRMIGADDMADVDMDEMEMDDEG
jgi:copper(I)-binding protein